MDPDESETAKRCYKCDRSVLNNVNIFYSASNSTIVLWNKFQIFIYEDHDFENAAKVIIPDFQIRQLLLCSNYLVCLDCTGNIHINFLKFKNTSQKRFKTCFQPKEQGVVDFIQYDQDHVLSLKYEHATFFLCLHRINTEFQLEKRISIVCNEGWPIPLTVDKYHLNFHLVTDNQMKGFKDIFSVPKNSRSNSILVMSPDKLNIYGCLLNFNTTEDEIRIVKLYSCPSEICNIEIIDGTDLNIIIGLTIGTLIRLSPEDQLKQPTIEHLNTALYKMLPVDNFVIYSDGNSMWKVMDVFSENVKFCKYFVKQAKDFIKVGDQIICTTFANLIYIFQIDDERSYSKMPSTEEYCSAEKVLSNIDCYHKIMEEVKKNNDLVQKLKKDGDYITALSLTYRQDIMDTVITTKVIVYEKYEDVTAENSEVILTEKLVNYFDTESMYILINIATTAEHKFDEILSNVLGDLKIHITLSTENKVLKTTSIRIREQLKKINFLIPVNVKDMELSEINVNIKIITDVPGAYNAKKSVWAVLYRKEIKLKSEHFINSNSNSNKQICLKEPQESLKELLLESARKQYGNVFEFIDNQDQKPNLIDCSFYIKLPGNNKDFLKSKSSYDQYFDTQKVNYLFQQFSSENFYKSKSSIIFTTGNTKVKIKIEDDGFSSPIMKVTSRNWKIALNIRHFFAKLIHKDIVRCGSAMEFISSSFYTSVENLQKTVKDCMKNSTQVEELLPLIEQFEKRVIGALPI